jgi:hypothetical protein
LREIEKEQLYEEGKCSRLIVHPLVWSGREARRRRKRRRRRRRRRRKCNFFVPLIIALA